MSGKIRNPARRCKICGGKCKRRLRYCKLCAKERREILTQRRKDAENAEKAFGGSLAQCVLDADLAALRSCETIYLLKGWENSRGTKMELADALRHNLRIWLEE